MRSKINIQSACHKDCIAVFDFIREIIHIFDIGEVGTVDEAEDSVFRISPGDLNGFHGFFQGIERGMGNEIGRTKSVTAEVAVMRIFAVVAAISISFFFEDSMVFPFPDTAAANTGIFIEKFPIFFDGTGTHTHCVCIFAEIIGTFIAFFIETLCFNGCKCCVHFTFYVNARMCGNKFAFCCPTLNTAVRAFVMDEAFGITGTDIIGHENVVFAEMAFVTERPEDDGNAVFITFQRACHTVDIRIFPERIA